MDIRPAPVHPVRGDGSGGRVTIAVPVLALVVVVAAAWAGARLETYPAWQAQSPAGDGKAGPQVTRVDSRPVFPTHVLGLPVMTGPELLEARTAGAVRRELVAVSGILRGEPLPLTCPAAHLTISPIFCHRLVYLFPVVRSPNGADASPVPATGQFGPQVVGHFLPGTQLPFALPSATEIGPSPNLAVPIVLLGRYEDPRAPECGRGREGCRDDVVVEQVVWAAGVPFGLTIVRDPAVSGPGIPDVTRLGEITKRADARQERIVGLALVRRDLLAVVDPVAALATANGPSTAVWYVRSIASAKRGQSLEVVWAVFEDATGAVLAYSTAEG